jgi:hypothetical protein
MHYFNCLLKKSEKRAVDSPTIGALVIVVCTISERYGEGVRKMWGKHSTDTRRRDLPLQPCPENPGAARVGAMFTPKDLVLIAAG